jgi:sugar/nucleoside kinase (ribokinase family)
MLNPLKIDINKCKYKAMIGVGGIGSGMFFKLNGDHTLGREESRSGYFLDRRDYCKLHIISHYVKALLGKKFPVIPIGKLGDDDVGNKLILEMKEIGFKLDYVKKLPGDQTLFSFCFIYPDGSGGNLTTSDSASSKVDELFIKKAESQFRKYKGKGVALAAPEIPLKSREYLIEMATEYGFFKAASFTSEEIVEAVQSESFKKIDLLGINLDEAAAAVGKSLEENSVDTIIEKSIALFTKINPKIILSITKGKDGSWSWHNSKLTHIPVFNVNVENTAGAGDAHLAGFIAGLTAGLSVREAQQLASLTSGSSVQSPHTINKLTDRSALKKISDSVKKQIFKNVYHLLENKL